MIKMGQYIPSPTPTPRPKAGTNHFRMKKPMHSQSWLEKGELFHPFQHPLSNPSG